VVIALSGRRIDAFNAKDVRFPLRNVDLVGRRIRSMFEADGVKALVTSAACGADLIALSEAGALGLPRRIVLPSTRDDFKRNSVLDRPGAWSSLYDEVLEAVSASGNLIVMDRALQRPDYSAASLAILDETAALAKELGDSPAAALIWDGSSRGDHDITEEFGEEARKRGLRVIEISTL